MRLPLRLVLLSLVAAPPLTPALAAPESASALKQLDEALRSEQAESLRLAWVSGVPSSGSYRRLSVEAGRATLESCDKECSPLGTPQVLSAGERAQLLSRLRAAQLGALRDSDADSTVDRQLEVSVAGSTVGTWRLPRADWPAPPDGYGVAEFLDDLGRQIAQTSRARKPLPIPRTVGELAALRLQLRVRPRTHAGGQVVVEHGELRVTPEEGSVPALPRLRPFTRSLSTPEQEQLLAELQAARLGELDSLVAKRAQPAIGDNDGRLATLHLLGSDSASKEERALQAALQPRGYERYLADWLRSPASPLVNQLLGFLATPPSGSAAEQKAATPPAPSGRAAGRRGR